MTLLDTRHGHPELKKANAMLAAAAPDLLAACEGALQMFGDGNNPEGVIKVLEAAISKARGHQ